MEGVEAGGGLRAPQDFLWGGCPGGSTDWDHLSVTMKSSKGAGESPLVAAMANSVSAECYTNKDFWTPHQLSSPPTLHLSALLRRLLSPTPRSRPGYMARVRAGARDQVRALLGALRHGRSKPPAALERVLAWFVFRRGSHAAHMAPLAHVHIVNVTDVRRGYRVRG